MQELAGGLQRRTRGVQEKWHGAAQARCSRNRSWDPSREAANLAKNASH
jgi:hypothetical protein